MEIKTPVSIRTFDDGCFWIVDTEGERVADDGSSSGEYNETMSINTTRRIVACLNIMQGIPTDAFEGKFLSEYVGSTAFANSSVEAREGGLHMTSTSLAATALVNAFAGLFEGTGAKNFVEMQFHHETIGDIQVTMQLAQGKSPGELLDEVRRERDALMAALVKLNADGFFGEGRCAAAHHDQPEQDDVDKRRAAFEAWFKRLNGGFSPEIGFGPGGHCYLHQRVEDAWQAWSAAFNYGGA